MTLRYRAAAPLAALALTVLSACGGGRPAAADLELGLKADTSLFPVAEQQTECAADLLLAADLSDEALRAIAEVDAEYEFSSAESTTLAGVQVQVLTTCTG